MSSFVLKLIAAVSMLCDHACLILFSGVPELRVIGRLAFPLYAFCIAEGFRHTRNRVRYFLRIFVLGVLCQIVFFIAEREMYLGILITFSFSILLMALVDSVKTAFRGEKSALAALVERISGKAPSGTADRILSGSLTVLFTVFLWFFTSLVEVDYGFFGILVPVFADLFDDRIPRFLSFSCCVLAVAVALSDASSHSWMNIPLQYWSLAALPFVFLYNGKPGKVRMKYFFYIFYPAHFVILYGISMLLR